jgi:hypothetical protein
MCEFVFKPSKSKEGSASQPRNCTRKLWKGNYCAIHHPEAIAAREAKRKAANDAHEKYQEEQYEWFASKRRAEICLAIMPSIIASVIEQRGITTSKGRGVEDESKQEIAWAAVGIAGYTVDCMANYFPGLLDPSFAGATKGDC